MNKIYTPIPISKRIAPLCLSIASIILCFVTLFLFTEYVSDVCALSTILLACAVHIILTKNERMPPSSPSLLAIALGIQAIAFFVIENYMLIAARIIVVLATALVAYSLLTCKARKGALIAYIVASAASYLYGILYAVIASYYYAILSASVFATLAISAFLIACNLSPVAVADKEDENEPQPDNAACTEPTQDVIARKRRTKKIIIIICSVILGILIFFFAIRPLVSLATGNYRVYINTYKIKNFEVPDGTTEIKDGAFLYCSSLKTITIPKSVTKIHEYAFEGCRFESFNIHADATCATEKVQFSTNTLRVFGDGDSKVQMRAFNGLSSCANIIFEEGVSKIDIDLFDEIRYVEKIQLPSTLKELSGLAFSGVNIGIGKLIVHADATAATKQLACKVNNLIITGDGDSTVKTNAFQSLSYLETITIGKGVKDVGSFIVPPSTLLPMGGLTVYVSKDVKDFSRNAFSDPSAYTSQSVHISRVYYEGNFYDWEAVYNHDYVGRYENTTFNYELQY
ncbi:MAG: leucine-rich repeat protein [Clostridia bacterium]|nr:leucine-rich repeat protein [Clostridia bacterium]